MFSFLNFYILFDYFVGKMKAVCFFGGFSLYYYSETEELQKYKNDWSRVTFVLVDSPVQERITYIIILVIPHLWTTDNNAHLCTALLFSKPFYIYRHIWCQCRHRIISHFWGLQNCPCLIWANSDGGACAINRPLTGKGHIFQWMKFWAIYCDFLLFCHMNSSWGREEKS